MRRLDSTSPWPTALAKGLVLISWGIALCGCSALKVGNKASTVREATPNWVHPLRDTPVFGLAPYERTRPILMGDILIVADLQGRVLAVDRHKGFILWETRMPGSVSGALAYGRSKVYVGDRLGNFHALNARDGSLAWSFKVQAEWLAPPAVIKGFVFAPTSSGDLYALDETTGDERWHYARRGDEKMSVWGTGGPAVFGTSEVFQGFSDGTLVALGAERGDVLWERRLRSRERLYDVDMVPYVDESRVIAGTYDGRVACLDRVTGEIRWVFPVGTYSGFVVDAGRVYFGGVNQQFYALDVTSGQTVWTRAFEGGIAAPPLLLRGSLIFPVSRGPAYLVGAERGELESTVQFGSGSLAGMVGVEEDGAFYGLSHYGNLYGFGLRDRAAFLPRVANR